MNYKIIAAVASIAAVISILTACVDEKIKENMLDGKPISSASSTTRETINQMPEPFEGGEEDGGDKAIDYYQPCNHKLDDIPFELTKSISDEEFNNWIDKFGIFPEAPTSLKDYANVYSFIISFNISDEEVTSVFTTLRELYLQANVPEMVLSDDEIQLLCEKNEKAIMEHFKSEYSIGKDGKIYTPQWVYTHTEEQYVEEGLSPSDIAALVDQYSVLPLSQEARQAFDHKLRSFTGKGLETEAPIPAAETTPAPPMAINQTTPLPEGFDPSLFDESPAESTPSNTDGSTVDTKEGLQSLFNPFVFAWTS